jgi:hypothetical protein
VLRADGGGKVVAENWTVDRAGCRVRAQVRRGCVDGGQAAACLVRYAGSTQASLDVYSP